MQIGEEIKQGKFEDGLQKAIINLIYTHNWFKENMSGFLKSYDITSQQYNVLRILNGQYPDGITTGEIRNRMLDKMSDASRLVDRLERCGHVRKNRNSDDRRLVTCVITDQGRALLSDIRSAEQTMYNPIRDRISDEEAEELSRILDKLRG
ncbi:MAG: MarR family transcriptional regulator [Flavobacteriia bacterium]|nr:MarR family transcriptional regulator [Flavobacteriia bacterium]